MNICVVGQGYVGLPVSIQAARIGYNVYGYDTDSIKIENLKLGLSDSPDVNQDEILYLQNLGNLNFISKLKPNLNISIFVIAVPTPLNDSHEPELSMLKSACEEISNHVSSNTLIINESTSYIGTLRNFIAPIIENNSVANNLMFAVAPERIDPGNMNWQIKNTPRLVSGLSENAIIEAMNFYSLFCDQVVKVEKAEVAEAAKLIENTFRQVNIGLINELSEISYMYNFSLNEAIKAASTKPFGYMPFYPSIGVGGHCIPVDPTYLNYSAKLVGVKSEFIDLANKLNRSMPSTVLFRIEKTKNFSFQGKLVQVVGIAYKSGISDLRESPALEIIRLLELKGAKVLFHDPFVKTYEGINSEPLRTDIDLGIIINPHPDINFKIWKDSSINVVDVSASFQNFGWPKFL